MEKFFDQVDKLGPDFKTRLSDAIQLESVVTKVEEKKEMAESLKKQLSEFGANAQLYDPKDGLPPIVYAHYNTDQHDTKKTILVYGHYDVQPAGDGWSPDIPPFQLTEGERKDKKPCYFGRGSTDDKSPVLAWLNMLQAHKAARVAVPVNIRFLFEGMEESGSKGLPNFIKNTDEGKALFANVDAACISDNYWLGAGKPCLTYGLRGIAYFKATVTARQNPLHSGIYGGTVYEPLTDLITLLSKLVDNKGNIKVPGMLDDVPPVTEEEKKGYECIDFQMSDLEAAIGNKSYIYDDRIETLQHRWRWPSLSIHGIFGADSSAESTTAIAPEVTAKFSIRTVPNMKTDKIKNQVTKYLTEEFKKLNSKSQLTIDMTENGEYWVTDSKHKNFEAGKQATQTIWGVRPDLTREGGSIPVALDIQEGLGKDSQGNQKSLMLLPIGTALDGAHGPDENIPIKNYTKGTKLLGAYLHHFANAN
ncbi:hypothetical protein EYZ11_002663 [Aspergillus tanneri]|nr:hypothetical protein EYZ11_002663 [Aspergillus tanneri]